MGPSGVRGIPQIKCCSGGWGLLPCCVVQQGASQREHCGGSVGGCLEEEAVGSWGGGTGGGPEPGDQGGDGLFSARAAVLGSAWKLQPRTKGLASMDWPSSAGDQGKPRSPSALQQERPVGACPAHGLQLCPAPPMGLCRGAMKAGEHQLGGGRGRGDCREGGGEGKDGGSGGPIELQACPCLRPHVGLL